MFIKKYLLLSLIPLLLSGESIVGKWEIDADKTREAIYKLSIDEKIKPLLVLISLNGYKSLECFDNKICVLAVHDLDSCMGKLNWKKQNNQYLLTTYKEKLCKDNEEENPKVTISGEQLKLRYESSNSPAKLFFQTSNNPSRNFSFIYKKSTSNQHQRIKSISLEKIQYNTVYKSKAIDTVLAYSSQTTTYFYLVFTDKDMFYSVGTTQSNISTFKEIKDIFKKKEEESKLSTKESLERLKNMPNTTDNDNEIRSLIHGQFSPNKHGITGHFNQYWKESDMHIMLGGVKYDAPRRCNQITFISKDKLACDNGVVYSLLDKANRKQNKKTILSKPDIQTNENIVNIDIQVEKEEEKRKADEAYLQAIQEMM